jgi:hypothetical protein
MSEQCHHGGGQLLIGDLVEETSCQLTFVLLSSAKFLVDGQEVAEDILDVKKSSPCMTFKPMEDTKAVMCLTSRTR